MMKFTKNPYRLVQLFIKTCFYELFYFVYEPFKICSLTLLNGSHICLYVGRGHSWGRRGNCPYRHGLRDHHPNNRKFHSILKNLWERIINTPCTGRFFKDFLLWCKLAYTCKLMFLTFAELAETGTSVADQWPDTVPRGSTPDWPGTVWLAVLVWLVVFVWSVQDLPPVWGYEGPRWVCGWESGGGPEAVWLCRWSPGPVAGWWSAAVVDMLRKIQ